MDKIATSIRGYGTHLVETRLVLGPDVAGYIPPNAGFHAHFSSKWSIQIEDTDRHNVIITKRLSGGIWQPASLNRPLPYIPEGATRISLAFDQLGKAVLSWQIGDTSFISIYDKIVDDFVTYSWQGVDPTIYFDARSLRTLDESEIHVFYLDTQRESIKRRSQSNRFTTGFNYALTSFPELHQGDSLFLDKVIYLPYNFELVLWTPRLSRIFVVSDPYPFSIKDASVSRETWLNAHYVDVLISANGLSSQAVSDTMRWRGNYFETLFTRGLPVARATTSYTMNGEYYPILVTPPTGIHEQRSYNSGLIYHGDYIFTLQEQGFSEGMFTKHAIKGKYEQIFAGVQSFVDKIKGYENWHGQYITVLNPVVSLADKIRDASQWKAYYYLELVSGNGIQNNLISKDFWNDASYEDVTVYTLIPNHYTGASSQWRDGIYENATVYADIKDGIHSKGIWQHGNYENMTIYATINKDTANNKRGKWVGGEYVQEIFPQVQKHDFNSSGIFDFNSGTL